MKKKTSKPVTVLVYVLVLCAVLALILIPTIRNLKNNPHKTVYYTNGVPDDSPNENTLVLTMQYDVPDDGQLETGKSPVVSLDSSFSSPLKMQRSYGNADTQVYWYDCENAAAVKTIYVKPPTFYNAVETETVPIPLQVGQVVKLRTGDAESAAAGQDWFSIRSLAARELDDMYYQVKVYVNALAMDAPRLVRLQVDGKEYGGMSSLGFSSSGWDTGEFLFQIHAADAEDALSKVATATLTVNGALLCADPPNLRFSANGAEVILVNEK